VQSGEQNSEKSEIMLVKIERYKVFQTGDRGRAIRIPSTWEEGIEPGTELEQFVDSETGALVIPPPVKIADNGKAE